MTNKKGFHYQILAIIILSVAVLGLLGYTFWNATQNKTSSTENNSTSTTTNVEKKKFNTNPGLGFKVSFDYPSNWSLAKDDFLTKDSNWHNNPSESIVLNSPTGKYSVKYTVASLLFFGMECSEEGKTLYSYHVNNLAGINKVYLVDTLYGEVGAVKEFATRLTNFNEYQLGKSDCSFEEDLVILSNNGPSTNIAVMRPAAVYINDLENSDGSLKTSTKVSDVEAARATDEYKQATDILLSTVYSAN